MILLPLVADSLRRIAELARDPLALGRIESAAYHTAKMIYP
jgi:hypothetical protein